MNQTAAAERPSPEVMRQALADYVTAVHGAYLDAAAGQMRAAGLAVTTHLALGDPPTEILKTAERERCDLIAMTTHGHRLIGDLIHGSTIEEVRHRAFIPILLVRAAKGSSGLRS